MSDKHLGCDITPTERATPRLSVCSCGHTGNTADSEHAPRFSLGHGPCKVPGCPCQQFTWSGWAKSPR